MIKTGQILKEAREKKGISIAEVSLATKINSKILNAIEQGNLSKLPPKTFLRGFVLSYAQYLLLDTDLVMKSFQEEMGSSKQVNEIERPSLGTSAPTAERSPPQGLARSNSSFAKLGAVVGIILLVAVIIMLKKKMDSYESESIPKPEETVVAIASPTPEPTADISTAIAESPTPSPAAGAAAVPTPVATATPTATATATATARATSTPTATPKASPSPTPVAAAAATASPSPSPTPGGRVQDVTIEALDDVDITAVIDGESRTIRLSADQVHTIKARRKVSLSLSDGGAVSIIVNGIDRGVPGDLGKPKKVDIP